MLVASGNAQPSPRGIATLFLPQLEIVRQGGRSLTLTAGSVSPWGWGEDPSSTAHVCPTLLSHSHGSVDLLQSDVLCLVNFLRRGRH